MSTEAQRLALLEAHMRLGGEVRVVGSRVPGQLRTQPYGVLLGHVRYVVWRPNAKQIAFTPVLGLFEEVQVIEAGSGVLWSELWPLARYLENVLASKYGKPKDNPWQE